jgi:broad specificity phosphatase PhoE
MTEIIIARHGETALNAAEVFRGRVDAALNETGLKQAALLAGYLSNLEIEALYSSPLRRAVQTAEAIGERCELKVNVELRLTDLDFGQWQGLSLQEVREKYGELYPLWENEPEQIRMPGGESLSDVRERVIPLVNDLLDRHAGRVMLVSHRVVNKVLLCALLGLDNSHFWNIQQDTCGVTAFTCERGRFILTRHNDTSFLEPFCTAKLRDF